jgi:hypothetical protein
VVGIGDRPAGGQLDSFGGRHERPRKPRPAWQPGLFTAEHEAKANAEAWEAALERFRRLGRDGDELQTVERD